MAPSKLAVNASSAGVVSGCDVRELGLTIVELGGGRKKTSDRIDPGVGLSSLKRVGDKVELGEPLAVIHARSDNDALSVLTRVQQAYKIEQNARAQDLIWRMI
jgi:thymidine phosphorylase